MSPEPFQEKTPIWETNYNSFKKVKNFSMNKQQFSDGFHEEKLDHDD